MMAPAALSLATTVESPGTTELRRAKDPAVVFIPSSNLVNSEPSSTSALSCEEHKGTGRQGIHNGSNEHVLGANIILDDDGYPMQRSLLLPLGAKLVEMRSVLESGGRRLADGAEGSSLGVDLLDTGEVGLQEHSQDQRMTMMSFRVAKEKKVVNTLTRSTLVNFPASIPSWSSSNVAS
jgi:hypothetical protein